MAPKYRLTYFDVYGAAEPIRFIFAYLNMEYEDVRVTPEEWQVLKPTMPYRKIPVLEIDGKPIPQSKCIARYLAQQYGLAGKDDWESLQCDSLVDTLIDFTQVFYNLHNENDQQKKDDLKKQIFSTDVPFYLGKFDKIIADNSEGYLVGSQVTWADLFFAANLGWLEELIPGFLKSYPDINSHVDKISNIPGVKVTWTDLFFAATLGMLEQLIPGFLKPHSAVNGHLEKIYNLPGVKVWIEKRPTNPTTLT